jgi:hypothetical protein
MKTKTIQAKGMKLKNRRVELHKLSNGVWLIRTRKLIRFDGKPEILRSEVRLTDEALCSIAAIYIDMKDEDAQDESETYEVTLDFDRRGNAKIR